MRVHDLMNSNIVTLRRESTLAEIYAIMMQYQQSDFPVVDSEFRLVGMLYQENILKAIFGKFRRSGGDVKNAEEFAELVPFRELGATLRADHMMVADEKGIPLDSDIVRAGAVMEARKVRHLAVLSQDRVVGMISESEIFMQLMRLAGAAFAAEKKTPSAAMLPPAASSAPSSLDPDPKEQERRRFSRRKVEMKIAYKPTDSEGKSGAAAGKICFCLNLSPGGMLLVLSEDLAPNQMVDVAFNLPGLERPIRRLARIVRVTPGNEPGMYHAGILFLVLSVDETAAIARYLQSL